MSTDGKSAALTEKFMQLMHEGHGKGEESILDAGVSPDYILHCPDGSSKNRDASRAAYAAMRNALSDFTLHCDLAVVDNNMLSARTTMKGRFTKPLSMAPMGQVDPNDKFIHFETISIYRFNADQVLVEEWAQSDNLTLMSQLGMLPPSMPGA